MIGGFLAQMLKEKCISNVFGDTFLMLSQKIYHNHDASVSQWLSAQQYTDLTHPIDWIDKMSVEKGHRLV